MSKAHVRNTLLILRRTFKCWLFSTRSSVESSATRTNQSSSSPFCYHYSLFFLLAFSQPSQGFCEKIQLCNMGGFHKINGAAILMLLLVMVMSQPSHARLLRGSHLCNFDATQQGPDLAFSGGKDVSEGEEAVSKYRPLLLNLLPKGLSPPSGPSKRTNNVGN